MLRDGSLVLWLRRLIRDHVSKPQHKLLSLLVFRADAWEPSVRVGTLAAPLWRKKPRRLGRGLGAGANVLVARGLDGRRCVPLIRGVSPTHPRCSSSKGRHGPRYGAPDGLRGSAARALGGLLPRKTAAPRGNRRCLPDVKV